MHDSKNRILLSQLVPGSIRMCATSGDGAAPLDFF